jgi:two-component system sensor histidine kinase AlgZ
MAAMILRRDWVWLLAINVIANVAVEATFREHSAQPRWLGVLADAWPGFIVSTTISTLCLLVLPRLTPILLHGLGPWIRWLILIVTLVALAVVGSALALALLTVVGHVDGWGAFVSHLQETMRIAILVTLVFGIYTTMNEALRSKLDQTTLALRTKERDEAEARRIASEAQLASLESRVNPHFFFNTLNSIAELTREDGARAERMTTQLASLMRSSLEAGSTALVPLAQEVQSIRDYLEIEHVRFGDRLRYEIRIANDAACALVPRLSLQTVVENSAKYAVSPRRDGASVSIVARREGDRVRVEVTDDGPGFDEGAMPEGHGLALIRDRLELLYGKDATLSVSSRPGQTIIGIVVPASKADA